MRALYRPGRASLAGIANGFVFVVIPLTLLRMIPTLLPEELPPELLAPFQALEGTILVVGTVVAVLAAFTAFFAKGLPGRAAFGAARQGSRLVWIHLVLQGGLIALAFEGFTFQVDFLRLLYVLYAAILLMAVFFVAEYLVYRGTLRPEPYDLEGYETGY